MFCLKQASQHVSQTSPFVLIFSEKSTLVKTNQIKYKLYSITSQLFYLYVAAPLHFFFISEYFKMQENWISNEKRQTQSSIHGNRYHRKCHGMPCRFFFYLKKNIPLPFIQPYFRWGKLLVPISVLDFPLPVASEIWLGESVAEKSQNSAYGPTYDTILMFLCPLFNHISCGES